MPQLKPFELAENMFGLRRPGKPPEPRQRAKELFEHQPRRVASIYFFFFCTRSHFFRGAELAGRFARWVARPSCERLGSPPGSLRGSRLSRWARLFGFRVSNGQNLLPQVTGSVDGRVGRCARAARRRLRARKHPRTFPLLWNTTCVCSALQWRA